MKIEWEYHSTQELGGRTYHLWEAQHVEGYTAYQVTHQPTVGYVKPTGNGHYVGKEGLFAKLGIELDSTPVGLI